MTLRGGKAREEEERKVIRAYIVDCSSESNTEKKAVTEAVVLLLELCDFEEPDDFFDSMERR